MIRRPPRSTRLTHSFPTRRSSDLAWVKLLNSGQTCIAPDYVLADKSIVDELVEKIVQNIVQFRSAEEEFALPIVNARQFDRLVQLLTATQGTDRKSTRLNSSH